VTDSSIHQVVLKIHSRCNLACDHCYVYEHADQSWRTRPVVISEETTGMVARRIAEYAVSKRLDFVSVILHGGEPLLAGPARLRKICAELTRVVSPVTSLDLRIHTNGVTLGADHLAVFREFGVRVSVSLDGDRAANDRHRLDRKGRSSYDRVLRAIDLLRAPENRHLYGGLLCTVDVANTDPVAVHDALTALGPPRIDYLLPHSTWDSPPPRPTGVPTPYADWLLKIFDRWEQQGRRIPVRTFESVLSTLRGGPSLTEAMGLAPTDLAVVETDGSFEQADSLKAAYSGAPETGYDVFRHSFEEFARHPGVLARQRGADGVSETCRRCPVLESCGGGLYTHRHSAARGFDNPSVFCADLRALVEGISARVTDHTLAPAVCGTGELRFAQVALNRGLLVKAHEGLAGDGDVDPAWRLLRRLDADPSGRAHLNAVLAHPYVHSSLRSSLRAAGDLPRFLATAAAAAVRAGTAAALSWRQPVRRLHLPTLGTLALTRPGRVTVEVRPDGCRVTDDTGHSWTLSEDTPRWRPLVTVSPESGPPLLVDDADPYRDRFGADVCPPLEPLELSLFRKRLRRTFELLDQEHGLRHAEHFAGVVTTVTPLVPGAHPRTGTGHGLGALGVAVDFEPGDLVRALPGIARRARLTALRQTTDLHPPGNRAGALLDEAVDRLGDAAHPAAVRALTELTLLPERELTPTGAVLAAQLWNAWADERHG
jgi:uncharacterized protein